MSRENYFSVGLSELSGAVFDAQIAEYIILSDQRRCILARTIGGRGKLNNRALRLIRIQTCLLSCSITVKRDYISYEKKRLTYDQSDLLFATGFDGK